MKQDPLLPAHFNKAELRAFDQMIGHPAPVDSETKLPVYEELREVFQNPQVMEIIETVREQVLSEGHVEKGLSHVASKVDKMYPNYRRPAGQPEEVKEIADKGEGSDTELALVPESVLDFLDELRGGQDINEETGYRQYVVKFFKKVVKEVGRGVGHVVDFGKNAVNQAKDVFSEVVHVVAPIVGGLMWGPTGAAGGAAAAELFNKKPNLQRGLMKAGLAYGGGRLLNSAMGAAMGQGASSAANEGIPSAIAASKETAPSFGKSLFDAVTSPTALAMGSMGLNYMQGRKQQKDYNRELDEWKKKEAEREKEEKEQHERDRRFYLRNSWFEGGIVKRARGGSVKPLPEYQKPYLRSGMIRGPGSGQDDLVYTNVPENSYIVDASTVSMLGDGSSKAGGKVLDNLVKSLSVKQRRYRTGGYVPVKVALSNEEYFLAPDVVQALGNGCEKKGSSVLKKAIMDIRAHKTTKGHGLPPKAKDLTAYLKKHLEK